MNLFIVTTKQALPNIPHFHTYMLRAHWYCLDMLFLEALYPLGTLVFLSIVSFWYPCHQMIKWVLLFSTKMSKQNQKVKIVKHTVNFSKWIHFTSFVQQKGVVSDKIVRHGNGQARVQLVSYGKIWKKIIRHFTFIPDMFNWVRDFFS